MAPPEASIEGHIEKKGEDFSFSVSVTCNEVTFESQYRLSSDENACHGRKWQRCAVDRITYDIIRQLQDWQTT
jgi:hypothetical protein